MSEFLNPDQLVNAQLVAGAPGTDHVQVMFPKRIMTRTEALVHAAWIVAVAEREPTEFRDILYQVRDT